MPITLGPLKSQIYPWDLEILVREVLLHAGSSGDLDLRQWNTLAMAVNHIRRLDNLASEEIGPRNDILLEIHRIAHRQFRWQTALDIAAIVRVLKIYGAQTIDALVLRELGMTTKQFLSLGAAIAGNFVTKWGMSTGADYAILGIGRDASTAFFERITCDIDQLRELTAKSQSYDDSWLYAWNPLEQRPVIRFNPQSSAQVICPVPRYLLARASTGIFYDLVNSRGFDNPYGHSFESYIGEVMSVTCKPPQFFLRSEAEYSPKKAERKHGIDWILSDETGYLFVECKTKRLLREAKSLTNVESLESDLAVMARAVVQTYKNIRDALDGQTNWSAHGLPVYPLIVTLEDWYLFNPRLQEMLDSQVRRLLDEEQINESVLIDTPFTIASAHEFEAAAQIIANVGVFGLMARKTIVETRQMALFPFLQTRFTEELVSAQRLLFPEDAKRLLPDPLFAAI
jgi:hypothetical protein